MGIRRNERKEASNGYWLCEIDREVQDCTTSLHGCVT
jgi:hypothetical protein